MLIRATLQLNDRPILALSRHLPDVTRLHGFVTTEQWEAQARAMQHGNYLAVRQVEEQDRLRRAFIDRLAKDLAEALCAALDKPIDVT